MATTKKSTGKRSTKTTAKKTTTRKKPTTSRAASTRAKSTPARKTRATSTRSRTKTTRSKAPQMQSFRVSKQQEPFMSMKITVQTLYWLILAGAVLLLGLWVLNIHNKVQNIYDEIDRSTLIQQELDAKELQLLREKNQDKKAND